MEINNKDQEPIVFTTTMMLQLVEQLNAVTTYFKLIDVKINAIQEKVKKLESKK